eukprot:378634_1
MNKDDTNDILPIDFNMFVNAQINDDIECAVNKCKSVERIIGGLVYYQTLNNSKNENSNGQSIFSEFLSVKYKHYLNDMNHIITIHDKDLERINELLLKQTHFISCDIDKCLLTDRHCQINDNKNGNIYANDKKMDL